MATKKDLVEAQGFSKRRLTTAFVAGAPGGRELEPQRPMRAVIGGLILTLVLILGSLAFGWMNGQLPDDWKNEKLIIAKDSAARYVSLKGVLYPVTNTTSARLLIPATSFRIYSVDDAKLRDVERGPELGIVGAPDSLPAPDRLANSDWVACLSPGGGVAARVGPSATSTIVPTNATVVRGPQGRVFLVMGRYRYPVPANALTKVTVALGIPGPPRPAPAAWVNLFQPGPTIAPLTVPGLGSKAPGLPSGATVGSVLTVASNQPDRAAVHYLVVSSGRIEPLSSVAYELYKAGSGENLTDLKVTADQVGELTITTQGVVPQGWPREIPRLLETTSCATLSTSRTSLPTVALSTSEAVTPPSSGLSTRVDTGYGALVRAVGGSVIDRGPILAIDQTATAYSLQPPGPDVLGRLGYQTSNVAPVPQAWTNLFRTGPTLSTRAAQTKLTSGS